MIKIIRTQASASDPEPACVEVTTIEMGPRHLSSFLADELGITIPTEDQSKSLAFYQSLGFEVRADFPWGEGYRWIEVYPPGTETGLVLMPAGPDRVGVRTGIILNTGDIDAAHQYMKQLGVDVDAGIARIGSPVKVRIGAVEQTEPQPPMFWFRDPDGNELLLVEPHRA